MIKPRSLVLAPALAVTRKTLNSTNSVRQLNDNVHRKRKTEWKRRQGGQSFLDHLVINVKAGNGGNGCVAFHREKFIQFGPPSGGNGGRGGDVYIIPTPHLTTLSSVPRRVRGEPGGNGRGTWQNGKNGAPLVIKVPLGTVVKEITGEDPRRVKDEWELEDEEFEGLSLEERREKMRERRWVHYPRYEEDNVQRDAFKEAEASLYRQERERRLERRTRATKPIYLDLDKPEDIVISPDAPLATGQHQEPLGHLVASGGMGGLGNPVFVSQTNRSPKFATRGLPGQRVTLSLELKLLADIGLVGMPNAGKSTLLRALTGGRAKTEIAGYAFTTLNPVVGVVRVTEDGMFEGESLNGEERVHEESWIERQREREMMHRGDYAFALPRNRTLSMEEASTGTSSSPDSPPLEHTNEPYRAGHEFDVVESFRFTIADNPGLISRASENVGLGHSFLRSIERSLALVYVVDLSEPAPWDALRSLRDELEEYKAGLSGKARMVIANKADRLEEGEEEARRKLSNVEEFVKREMVVEGATRRVLDVVPISAKFSQNLRKVVGLLRGYVQEGRRQQTDEGH